MSVLYLGDQHIRAIGLNWEELVDSMEAAVRIIDSGDYAQPIKPYLRYRNPANRIIAMPAYVGGAVQTAGIKWIASFPGNIDAEPVLFCPMGMAVFDIAVADYFVERAKTLGIGLQVK